MDQSPAPSTPPTEDAKFKTWAIEFMFNRLRWMMHAVLLLYPVGLFTVTSAQQVWLALFIGHLTSQLTRLLNKKKEIDLSN